MTLARTLAAVSERTSKVKTDGNEGPSDSRATAEEPWR